MNEKKIEEYFLSKEYQRLSFFDDDEKLFASGK